MNISAKLKVSASKPATSPSCKPLAASGVEINRQYYIENNMFNPKEFGIHLMTIVLVICIPIYVIPNLTTNLKNYNKGEGTLINTKIDEREYTSKYSQKRVERTLIVNLDNGMELKLSGQYSKFWEELQDKQSIGKKITYYLGNNTAYGSNPVQIEIDKKIIYDPSENIIWAYILVFMTIGCVTYSGRKLYLFMKSN